ncbi:hypothetical protein GCM10010403_39890 [Glycomyces rutgersensis]|uniref:Uncharacterized protein n=2 Tax=Glycomyces rutgersensis TaxID=58115 RepID=A0ABN3G2R3_9ACTN
MAGHWAQVRERSAEQVRAAVESPASEPAIATAARAYLDGAPDPLGAAAVFQVGADTVSLYEVHKRFASSTPGSSSTGPSSRSLRSCGSTRSGS